MEKPTWSTILCFRMASLSRIFMATLSPVSEFWANFTFANVPSPMVLPTSYFPTFLITMPSLFSVPFISFFLSRSYLTPYSRLCNTSIKKLSNQSFEQEGRERERVDKPSDYLIEIQDSLFESLCIYSNLRRDKIIHMTRIWEIINIQ